MRSTYVTNETTKANVRWFLLSSFWLCPIVFCVVAPSAFATPEPAKSADAFVDAIGINTHFGNAIYPENAYANRQISTKLADLGIRHIRDHSFNDTALKIVDELHRKHRIGATLVLGETTRSPAQLVALLKAHPGYEAIEGLNEPDFTQRTYKSFTDDRSKNDYSATRAFQNELYAALKADAKTKKIPLLSPAMGRAPRARFLMPIQFDIAALHRYPWEGKSAMEPSFGMDETMQQMEELRGNQPLWVTETGYYNEPAAHPRSAPEDVAALYMPRLVAEFFNRGAARTYLYELADQGPDKSAREQNFGLLRHDMTEKPAFIAMKNLFNLLKEPKAGHFETEALDYTLDVNGDLSKIQHTLLQKQDHTFYLLLWQEVRSYEGTSQQRIVNANISAILTLTRPFNVNTYLPSRSAEPTAVQRNVTTLNLNVPDQMLIVELSQSR